MNFTHVYCWATGRIFDFEESLWEEAVEKLLKTWKLL
jgi:hypothetical protein